VSSISVEKAREVAAIRRAAVAHDPFELVEEGVPHEDELIAWQGPWTYYKSFPVTASAAHPEHEEGEVLRWAVGQFTVRTNHEKAEGRPRSTMGLIKQRGSHEDPPETYEQLKAWVSREDLAPMSELSPSRPDLPPFKMQEVGSA